jgi:hypothetical protein
MKPSVGLSCALGAGYVAVIYGLIGAEQYGSGAVFLGSFLSMGILSYLLGRAFDPPWAIGFFVFVGISAAVFTNAVYDYEVYGGVDHNLWPFEIVFLSVFGMPGVLVGLVAARLARSLVRSR